MSLLGVDVGSTGTKAVLFNGDGAVLGRADSRIAGRQVTDKGSVWDH